MADVAKKTSTVQQTVSSPHTPNGTSPLCELTTTQSGSFSDLSLPHEDDDTSLQDLIDSELALRIARSPSPPARGDVNTRFILEERNHSFQTYTGNDTFFFSTLEDSPPSNGEAAGAASPEEFPPSPPGSDSSPRCLPQSLAAFDPFTTTIDTESSPSADSELVCMAGELASPLEPPPGGVLLDFSEGDLPDDIGPYQTDTNPSRVVENGTLLDLSEGTPQELVGAFPEEVADDFLDPFGSSYREGSVTPDERQQGVDFLDECSLPDLVSPASSPTNLDDDAAGVVNNSMSSDDVNNPSSVVECCVVTPNVRSPGAVLIPEIDVIPPDDDDQVDEDLDMYVSSGYGVADDAEGDENEWTTVAEAVGSPEEETPPKQQLEVAVNGADTPTSVSSCSESDLSTEMVTEKKIKKKRSEGGEVTKTKKTKKNKKSDSEKENISVKSSFSKFDQLSKKSSILHVRSSDASKAQKQFNQSTASTPEQTSNCKSCGKQVFQMEQVKAERAVWHKNCFRCKECNKQLTLDIYSSHEGQLYCKPHFRELFKPKAVVEDEKEMPRRRRHEMIIRESQPIELPPGVVRASDKPDLGLEECSSLNVKSRFQVFEKGVDAQDTDLERSPSNVNVKRSPSILSKLARFQAKGMDIGVTDDSLNGIPYEETSSSSEEEEEEEEEGEETGDVVRSSRKHKERPVSFGKMEDMKCRWESGTTHRKEELREERKHEISNIRSRLFMGHQGKMKEMYEQAVQESERSIQKKGVDIAKSENARNLKEKFERGEILPDDDEDGGKEDPGKRAKDEDLSVFEAGISKKSRSLFLELDATAAKTQQAAPLLMSPIKSPAPVREDSRKLFLSRQASEDVVRASDTIEDVQVETDEVSSKFKFFETFKPQEKQKKQFRITPPREGQVKAEVPDQEIYRDPTVVRCEDKQQDEEEVVRSHTTSKMLSLFRQLEENATKEDMPEGPKPLKRFTPPPDYTHESESSEEESETEDEEEEEDEEETINPNLVRASDKIEDEFLKQSQNAARAKVLRAKFERWEEKENKANAALVTEQQQQQQQNGLDGDHIEQASIDTTKSLRARFESMKSETQQPKEKPRPKVNRFV